MDDPLHESTRAYHANTHRIAVPAQYDAHRVAGRFAGRGRPRRGKHTFDRAKKSTPLSNALSKLISDAAGNADALFNLVDRTG